MIASERVADSLWRREAGTSCCSYVRAKRASERCGASEADPVLACENDRSFIML
ncbi:MAG: hypothetical protein MZV64_36225 [Ignavibacteriales bacterium]|nr:hypothetical protein [Ignavibacteriales bacterium]